MKRSTTLHPAPSALAEEQALSWITKLAGAAPSAQQQADFAVWLSLDPSHRPLFDDLADIWELSGRLTPSALGRLEADVDPDLGTAPSTVAATNRQSNRASRAPESPESKAAQRTGSMLSYMKVHLPLAASALLALGLVWFSSIENPNTQWLATGTGDYTKVVLTDGSKLHLNTNTRVRIAYTEHARLLQLVTGELFIEVAKDAKRPLTVATESFSATAIGTAFGVASLAAKGSAEEKAFVAVAHGEVLVRSNTSATYRARGDSKLPQQLSLLAGDKLAVDESAANLGKVGPTSAQIAGWRGGQLVYQDVTLQALIADLNRYHPQQLVIQDPALAQVRVSAVLNSVDYQNTVAALCSSLGLTAQDLSDTVTLLVLSQ